MTTHAIFFLIYGCPMSGTVFKKKSSFKVDNDDDDDNTKVRTALPGAKERRAKNNDKCAFAVVAVIAGTSQLHTRSSPIIGTL